MAKAIFAIYGAAPSYHEKMWVQNISAVFTYILRQMQVTLSYDTLDVHGAARRAWEQHGEMEKRPPVTVVSEERVGEVTVEVNQSDSVLISDDV
jgi:hypothetical protein